ncbi:MAG TPA: PPC domain-containing protein [Planctomycetota bacterium]|nr:PPC domain-containing protein [Planctomycetota bacterium]
MSKAGLLVLVLLAAAPQDDKKAPPDPKPRVSMGLPLAISPGEAAKVTLRGQNLDQASEVKFAAPIEGATLTLKSKGKAEIPKETDPAVYGDTKVEIEIQLPPGYAADTVRLVAVHPKGEAAYDLRVLAKATLVAEKEPNGGFATAQPVEAGQTIQGAISQAMDVDVFKFTGRKGETWTLDVEAQRRGSVLDALLTLHDAAGHIVATADDSELSRDPTLKVTLPRDGAYCITLIDAHNSGGATHPYLLHLRRD